MAASLKCVIAWSERRNLCDLIEEALRDGARPQDIVRVGDDSYLVYSDEEPWQTRDSVRSSLQEGESVLVIEFEKWSGYGPGVAGDWLLARGH